MPVFGTGIMPSGSIGTELSYVTRRAFVPKMVVQIYNSTPLLAALIANSQVARGGASQVSVPVQGAQFVTPQYSDYSGAFNQPAIQQGAYLTEQNLKLLIVPIPVLGMESVVQDEHAIIDLAFARMNDAGNAAAQTLATSLYSSTANTQAITGLPFAIDDGTNATTYGNINRTTNTWWKSKVYAAGSVNPTRQNMMQYIAGTTKAGAEVPTFGVCGFGTWTLLAQDFVGQEIYNVSPDSSFDTQQDGPRSAFRALMVGGVPIFADPFAPEGTVYFINSNYLSLYIHEMASFAFTGYESTISNFQVGYIGAVLVVAELVSVKPVTMSRISGFNSLTL
jgi:hypothetical protein